MKKLLLSLVAVLIGLSAHAVDYYLIGGFNGWTLAQPNCKFTAGSNGEYTLDLNVALTTDFKINDGTWSNDAANFGGSASLNLGETYNLTTGGSSGNINFSDKNLTVPNAHLVFNPTAKTLVVTGNSQQASTIYGIHGNIFGGTEWSTVNMTESNGKFVLANRTVGGGSFGIKAMNSITGSQTAWISADGNSVVTVGTPMNCKIEGTNFSIAAGTYTFTFDPDAMTLVVTGTQTGDTPGVDYSSWWVNVIGPFNDWQDNGVNPVNGVSVTENLGIGTQGFKVKVWDGSKDSYYVSSEPVPVGEWYELTLDESDAQPTQIAGATENSVYTVQYNVETNKVYITEVSSDGETPTNVYVIGDIVGNVWQPANGVPMKSEGEGVFSIKGIEFQNGDNGATMAYFALTTLLSSDWNVVNNHRYGPKVKDTEIVVGEENPVDGEGDLSWSIVAGKYNLTFDYNNKTLDVETYTETDEPGDDTLVVYENGTLLEGLTQEWWWNASWNLKGENPDGNGEVLKFWPTDPSSEANKTAASMGLMAHSADVTGPLHNATLNFNYYATGTGNYTVRLTCSAEYNYNFAVTAENANKWNTVAIDIAKEFPALSQGWNENKNFGEDYVFSIVLADGSSNAAIYFDKIYYTNVDASWVAPKVDIPAPETVPVPQEAKADVVSVFSSAYTPATAFNIGGWGQSTQVTDVTIDNNKLEWLRNFNYLGWELTNHIDVSDCQYMHVDMWTDATDAKFGFTPISSDPTMEKGWVAPSVVANEWNSYDVDLSYFAEGGVDLSNIFQIKFDQGTGYDCYIGNVYFYKEGGDKEDVITYVLSGPIFEDGTQEKVMSVDANNNATCVARVQPQLFNIQKKVNGKTEVTYGAASDVEAANQLLTLGTYQCVANSGIDWDLPATIGQAGAELMFTFNITDLKLTVADTTGVESVETENGEAVYYDLQGRKVNNPTKGIYIQVCNGKTVKVVK